MSSPQEVRSLKSEVRSQRSEAGSQRPEVRGQKAEVGSQRSEVRTQNLAAVVEEAYSQAIAEHGDLGLSLEDFAARLNSIVTTETSTDAGPNAAARLVEALFTSDLYLAAACAQNNDAAAWDRLFKLYERHIKGVAHAVCNTHQEASDVSSTVFEHVFFPGRKGQRRIASFEGRCSLAGWLATITRRRAINQSQIKHSEALPLDSLRQETSAPLESEMDVALMNLKYSEVIADSLRAGAASLSEQEKRVLVLHLEADLTAAEIARRLGVHKATTTRAIDRAEEKLRLALFARLSTHHGLTPEAVRECVGHILRNPEASLAVFLRAAA